MARESPNQSRKWSLPLRGKVVTFRRFILRPPSADFLLCLFMGRINRRRIPARPPDITSAQRRNKVNAQRPLHFSQVKIESSLPTSFYEHAKQCESTTRFCLLPSFLPFFGTFSGIQLGTPHNKSTRQSHGGVALRQHHLMSGG